MGECERMCALLANTIKMIDEITLIIVKKQVLVTAVITGLNLAILAFLVISEMIGQQKC